MKYTNTQRLPKDFFRNIWLITEKAGQPEAQKYATSVSENGPNMFQSLFTYKGCEVDYDAHVYCQYTWSVIGYDGAPDSPNRGHWGKADTIEEILEQIEEFRLEY